MYTGQAAIGYILKKFETFVSSMTSTQNEVVSARGGKLSVDARLDDIETGYVKITDMTKLRTLKNLISNGAFNLDTTGWTTSDATISVVNGIANVTATAIGGGISQQALDIPPSVVIYARCLAQSVYATDTKLLVRTQTSGDAIIADHTVTIDDISQIKKYSLRFVTEATTAKLACMLIDSKDTPWGANKWDNIVLLNLTSIFGAGNEPTIEAMDAFMEALPNGYVDGFAVIFKA